MVSSQLYTKLLDNLVTAIVLMDKQHNIEYLNPAAEVLLQSSHQKTLGQPAVCLFNYESHSKLKQLFENVFSARRSITKRRERLTLLNGKSITADITVTPSEDHLIIEIQPLDRLLKISREEARLADQHTSQMLVRGLAHEIKNPLGGLRGAAQLLSKELPDPQLQDYTSIIIEEADRLRSLVDRLLGSNKIAEKNELNIHEVLERVFSLIDAESDGRLKLVRDYDPSIPAILGDKSSLIQAVLNITRNAKQALEKTPSPTITFRTRTLRQFTIGMKRHRLVCRVDIIDNGPGIPPKLQDTLFLPMVSGRANGTGLGLSIAQSIINQHQGLIECHSVEGKTCFSLYLPILSPENQTKGANHD